MSNEIDDLIKRLRAGADHYYCGDDKQLMLEAADALKERLQLEITLCVANDELERSARDAAELTQYRAELTDQMLLIGDECKAWRRKYERLRAELVRLHHDFVERESDAT